MTTDERKGWVAVDYESRKKGRKEGIKAGASAERERILEIIDKWQKKPMDADRDGDRIKRLRAEIEQCSSEEHAHASKRRIEKG